MATLIVSEGSQAVNVTRSTNHQNTKAQRNLWSYKLSYPRDFVTQTAYHSSPSARSSRDSLTPSPS